MYNAILTLDRARACGEIAAAADIDALAREEEPTEVGEKHLAPHGWSVRKRQR